MKFSIVIPTYNEEQDISATLDSLVALKWPDKEILVVDDSTDNTPKIVELYVDRGVRLVLPKKREGRCGARNLGIVESSGDVVVILNADVHLKPDFLQRIAPYYANGVDYVLVRSVVENFNDLFPRFVESSGIVRYCGMDPKLMEWSEGFSCRRELAIRAGMFPVGFSVPICAGEDGYFGASLKKLGAKKRIDLGIVVTHVAPAKFSEYWYIRKGRGKGSPQIRHFLHKWSLPRIALWATLRIGRTLLYVGTLLPMLFICWRIAKASCWGQRDLLPFCWAWLVEQAAFHVGEWGSIYEIQKAERRLVRGR